jgi:hypothetical protein
VTIFFSSVPLVSFGPNRYVIVIEARIMSQGLTAIVSISSRICVFCSIT